MNQATGAGRPDVTKSTDEPAKPVRPSTINGVDAERARLAEEVGIEIVDGKDEEVKEPNEELEDDGLANWIVHQTHAQVCVCRQITPSFSRSIGSPCTMSKVAFLVSARFGVVKTNGGPQRVV